MNVFAMTARPNPSLLYRRNDANDIRLGEVVQTAPEQYDSADVVLLGLPQDEGVRRNKGRIGASAAPDAIRQSLYKYVAIDGLRLFDLGNTQLGSTLEATHQTHQDIVQQVLRDGKTLVVLGGGNDTSYPDCSALSLKTNGNLLAFNVDAHFDVRADAVRNSGTPYRQLLEEGLITSGSFYEIGYQPFANSSTYVNYLAEKGVRTFALDTVHETGLTVLLQNLLHQHDETAVFWGLDMDVVRGADAPGVSALNPTGLTGAEFCQIGRIAGAESRTRILEITEVNPAYDVDGLTCRLAAAAVWYFLATRGNNPD